MYIQHIQGLCQFRLSTAGHALLLVAPAITAVYSFERSYDWPKPSLKEGQLSASRYIVSGRTTAQKTHPLPSNKYIRTNVENTSCNTGSVFACTYCGCCLEMGLLYCWLRICCEVVYQVHRKQWVYMSQYIHHKNRTIGYPEDLHTFYRLFRTVPGCNLQFVPDRIFQIIPIRRCLTHTTERVSWNNIPIYVLNIMKTYVDPLSRNFTALRFCIRRLSSSCKRKVYKAIPSVLLVPLLFQHIILSILLNFPYSVTNQVPVQR
jgi:hypothetical protein